MKVKKIERKLLERIGFLYGGTYYYMYNPTWEDITTQLIICKKTGDITYTNGSFKNGEKAIQELRDLNLIEED